MLNERLPIFISKLIFKHFLGNKTIGDEKIASIYLQRTEDEIEKQFLEYKDVYSSNVSIYQCKLPLNLGFNGQIY